MKKKEKITQMKRIMILVGAVVLFGIVTETVYAQSLGKFYIAIQLDENGFAPSGAEDTVKDMHNRIARDRELSLAEDEADADFMITIVSREENIVSGQSNSRRLTSTLSVKDEGDWKPGTRISKVSTFWNISAIDTLNDAKRWIKANIKK